MTGYLVILGIKLLDICELVIWLLWLFVYKGGKFKKNINGYLVIRLKKDIKQIWEKIYGYLFFWL